MLFLGQIGFWYLVLWAFHVTETLPRVPSMWTFFPESVPLKYYHLSKSPTTVFLLCLLQNPLTASTVLNGGKADLPTVGYLSASSPVFSVITLHFFSHFSFLLADSLFWLSVFAKCHVGLLLRNLEGSSAHAFCLCVNVNRWAVTNSRDRVMKELMRVSHWWQAHLCLCSDLCTKVCALCNDFQLISCGNWKLSCVVWGRLVFLN